MCLLSLSPPRITWHSCLSRIKAVDDPVQRLRAPTFCLSTPSPPLNLAQLYFSTSVLRTYSSIWVLVQDVPDETCLRELSLLSLDSSNLVPAPVSTIAPLKELRKWDFYRNQQMLILTEQYMFSTKLKPSVHWTGTLYNKMCIIFNFYPLSQNRPVTSRILKKIIW